MVETMGAICSIDDLIKVSGSKPEFVNNRSAVISQIGIDSRETGQGSLFVPIKGERTDGHFFVGQAFYAGAVAAFIDRTYWQNHREELAHIAKRYNRGLLIVDNTVAALQETAFWYRKQMASLYAIGVTGSNGKTTTKEIIGSIFSESDPTMVSPGNLNSDIGLPLAISLLQPHHIYGVFEMGINYPGEMDILSRLAAVDAALITGIGTAHIGPLGSREGIANEKRKIFTYFSEQGRGFLPETEPFFNFLSNKINGKVLPYGRKTTPGFRGSVDLGLDGSIINWEDSQIRLPLPGPYNVENALGAISVARELGIDRSCIVAGIEKVTPLFGRGQIVNGRATVIHDSYNANPDSILAVARHMDQLNWNGRKAVVLGSMKELGQKSEQQHEEVLNGIFQMNFDMYFFMGEEFKEAFQNSPHQEQQVLISTEYEKMEGELSKWVKSGDLVLLKGSRSMEMERFLDVLLGEQG
jgi:UDP-N-acetylmuramoyl-tripeptide--D-alanyl-D-alanine ligase